MAVSQGSRTSAVASSSMKCVAPTARFARPELLAQKHAFASRALQSKVDQQPLVWNDVSSRRSLTASASATTSTPARTEQRVPKRADFAGRCRVVDIKGGADEGMSNVGKEYEVRGWVRTVRDQKTFSFVEINDGSTLAGLQAVLQADECEGYDLITSKAVSTGAAVCVKGKLIESKGSNQKVELAGTTLEVIGECPSDYPLQKKRHTLEFLRGIAHLRPRTNLIGAVTRVRNALAYATHTFFQERGFLYVNTPIITASDCEGAGEQFLVTTLVHGDDPVKMEQTPHLSPERIEELQGQVDVQAKAVKELKASGASKENVKAAVDVLLALKAELEVAEENQKGEFDFDQDFFSKPAYLTVSGQLNAEIYACALRDVYTFGPTFRAENSNTTRHLAEFWMVEPEMAFATLEDDMACAEAYLKHCVRYVLENCKEDMEFFDKFTEKGLIQRLTDVAEQDFATITYTEAVEELLKVKDKFEYPVVWGNDLQSEHERYLTEVVFDQRPLIVTDYPKDIKAFYMRENEDGLTVAAMDVLVPKVGELMGGSQREERLDVLKRRLEEIGLPEEPYWWYMDLRKYGSVPHSGFGLGFERLVQFATGVDNIRDVIPFPRYPGNADF